MLWAWFASIAKFLFAILDKWKLGVLLGVKGKQINMSDNEKGGGVKYDANSDAGLFQIRKFAHKCSSLLTLYICYSQ